MSMCKTNSYLKVLGIEPGSTLTKSLILASFKKSAKTKHPDKDGHTNEFVAIVEARDYLLNMVTLKGRGSSDHYDVLLTERDIIEGETIVSFQGTVYKVCEVCHNSPCIMCKGDGAGSSFLKDSVCPYCDGSGKSVNKCKTCKGRGFEETPSYRKIPVLSRNQKIFIMKDGAFYPVTIKFVASDGMRMDIDTLTIKKEVKLPVIKFLTAGYYKGIKKDPGQESLTLNIRFGWKYKITFTMDKEDLLSEATQKALLAAESYY